jgi:hypothetical protein
MRSPTIMEKPTALLFRTRNEGLLNWLLSLGDTPNGGMSSAVNGMFTLYNKELRNMHGLFTVSELCAIVDACREAPMTPELLGSEFERNVGIGLKVDKLEEKWRVNAKILEGKIAGLTLFQKACLEMWSQLFWKGNPELPIMTYVDPLVR